MPTHNPDMTFRSMTDAEDLAFTVWRWTVLHPLKEADMSESKVCLICGGPQILCDPGDGSCQYQKKESDRVPANVHFVQIPAQKDATPIFPEWPKPWSGGKGVTIRSFRPPQLTMQRIDLYPPGVVCRNPCLEIPLGGNNPSTGSLQMRSIKPVKGARVLVKIMAYNLLTVDDVVDGIVYCHSANGGTAALNQFEHQWLDAIDVVEQVNDFSKLAKGQRILITHYNDGVTETIYRPTVPISSECRVFTLREKNTIRELSIADCVVGETVLIKQCSDPQGVHQVRTVAKVENDMVHLNGGGGVLRNSSVTIYRLKGFKEIKLENLKTGQEVHCSVSGRPGFMAPQPYGQEFLNSIHLKDKETVRYFVSEAVEKMIDKERSLYDKQHFFFFGSWPK